MNSRRIIILVLLHLIFSASYSQYRLFYQGFENSACDNWQFSGGLVALGTQRTGTHSGRVGYLSNTLTFSTVNVSGFPGLVLTIYHAVNSGAGPGMDGGEGAVIQLSLNGGAYTTISSVSGLVNTGWSFNSPIGGDASNLPGCNVYTSPNPVVVNLPVGTNTVQIRIISISGSPCALFNNFMNNATPGIYNRSDEGFYVDDVTISTTAQPPPIKLTSGLGTDAQQYIKCGPVNLNNINYDIGWGGAIVTGLPPDIGFSTSGNQVTISGTLNTTGNYQYTVTGCTGETVTGTIEKKLPAPIISPATINSCSAVVFKGKTYSASTLVRDTIQSSLGCDSLYNVTQINITPVIAVTRDSVINSCKDVLFAGKTYTSSVLVRDTVPSYLGCDSICRVVQINIIPVTTVTIDSVINSCKNVIFGGKTYTTSVLVRDTVRSYLGCDSIYHVTQINITPVSPVTYDSVINSCKDVVFAGKTYTTSVLIRDTVRSYLGCDSIYYNTQINIKPVTPVTRDSVINSCNDVLFAGKTYTTSVLLRDTVRSYLGCDSIYNDTQINVTRVALVIFDSVINSCKDVLFAGKTYSSSTLIRDTIRSYLGCDSIYNVTQINITPVVAVTFDSVINSCRDVFFAGKTYTSSVLLRDTVRSYLGCDSSYHLTHINITRVTAITRDSVINSCRDVLFLGKSYTSSVLLRDTVPSYLGCDSIYNVTQINITPVAPVTRDSEINSCKDVLFAGKSYSSSTLVRDTVLSYLGCDSIYNNTQINITPVLSITYDSVINSCRDVMFAGKTYTSSVLLRDTVHSYLGCDSIYHLTHINIIPVLAITRDSVINSCLDVMFAGKTYTSTILLRDTVRSYLGCDSIYHLTHINITRVVSVTRDSVINSCRDVLFAGRTYSSSTLVRDTVRSYLGCDSIYRNTQINIVPVASVVRDSVILSCKDVLYAGKTYSSSTLVRDTVRSYLGCDSIYNVTQINIIPVSPVTYDSVINSCRDVLFAGKIYASTVLLRDTVRSYLGCDSIYHLTHINIMRVVTVTRDSVINSCQDVLFAGKTYTSSVIVHDTIRSYLGCDSIYNITQINIKPVAPVIRDSVINSCRDVLFSGKTYTSSVIVRDTTRSFLDCDSIYNITRINITRVIPVTRDSVINSCRDVLFGGKTYTSSVLLRDTIRSYLGCDSIYHVTQINIIRVTPILLTNTLNGCGNVVLNNATFVISTVLRDTIQSVLGCDSIYRITNINVYRQPGTSRASKEICENNLPYLWNGNRYTNSGAYSIRIPLNSYCDSIAILDLTVNPKPVKPNFGKDTILCPDEVLRLNPGTYNSYQWQDNSVSTNFSVSVGGVYWVMVSSDKGCINGDTILVSYRANCSDLFFPSAFNPGSTAGNNSFGPLGNMESVSRYSIQVYNRWGEVVFSSSNPYQRWNGMYKGQPQPVSSFTWYCSYNFNGVDKLKKGTVVLVR